VSTATERDNDSGAQKNELQVTVRSFLSSFGLFGIETGSIDGYPSQA